MVVSFFLCSLPHQIMEFQAVLGLDTVQKIWFRKKRSGRKKVAFLN